MPMYNIKISGDNGNTWERLVNSDIIDLKGEMKKRKWNTICATWTELNEALSMPIERSEIELFHQKSE